MATRESLSSRYARWLVSQGDPSSSPRKRHRKSDIEGEERIQEDKQGSVKEFLEWFTTFRKDYGFLPENEWLNKNTVFCSNNPDDETYVHYLQLSVDIPADIEDIKNLKGIKRDDVFATDKRIVDDIRTIDGWKYTEMKVMGVKLIFKDIYFTSRDGEEEWSVLDTFSISGEN